MKASSFLAIALLSFFCIQLAMAAEGRIPISEPGTVSASGSYIVTCDLTAASGAAISVAADNVTIDLDGHTVSALNGWGIRMDSGKNLKVSNGRIVAASGVQFISSGGHVHVTDLDITVTGTAGNVYGILVESGGTEPGYGVVRGNAIRLQTYSSLSFGISYWYAKGSIEDNKITAFDRGIQLYSANNVFVQQNYCGGNHWGLNVWSSTNIVIKNNILSDNTDFGMRLADADLNTIAENSVSGNPNYGIYLDSNSDHNDIHHNTTACDSGVGMYIWGCGNIYSNNKAPGACGASMNTTCTDPNIDGNGNDW
jgi:parallel beta-helix repeat protein